MYSYTVVSTNLVGAAVVGVDVGVPVVGVGDVPVRDGVVILEGLGGQAVVRVGVVEQQFDY